MGRSEEIEKAARKTIKLIRELAGYEVGSMHPNDFAVRDEEVTHDVLRLHAEHGAALWKWRWKMGRSEVEAAPKFGARGVSGSTPRGSAPASSPPTPAACPTCGSENPEKRRSKQYPRHTEYCPDPFHAPPAEAEPVCDCAPPVPGKDGECLCGLPMREPAEAAPREEAQEQDGPCQHDWHEEATSWRCPACNEGPEEAAQKGGEDDPYDYIEQLQQEADEVNVLLGGHCFHHEGRMAAIKGLQARAAQEQEGGDPAKRRVDAQREEGRFASLDPWDWAIDALNNYECSAGIEAEDRDELRSILHRMFRDDGQARAGQGRKTPSVDEIAVVLADCDGVTESWGPSDHLGQEWQHAYEDRARAVLRLLGEGDEPGQEPGGV